MADEYKPHEPVRTQYADQEVLLRTISTPRLVEHDGLLCTVCLEAPEHKRVYKPVTFDGKHLAVVDPKCEGHDAETNTADTRKPVSRREFNDAYRILAGCGSVMLRTRLDIADDFEHLDSIAGKDSPYTAPHSGLMQQAGVMETLEGAARTVRLYLEQEAKRACNGAPKEA